MWRFVFLACCAVALNFGPRHGRAADLLPPDASVAEAIDHYIEARLRSQTVSPAAAADDANLLRRTMLDLIGRPPMAIEARVYLADSDPGKHEKLVDRLLASPAFARQQAAEFDAWLMNGTRVTIRDYLIKAFRENRPWDRMFREMIVGEPDDAGQRGAIRYVASRAKDPDRLTSDTSVHFFGVNVSCAKCHDHPLVADWKQDHYFGMLSFYSRTFDVGEFFGEREYGRVTFKTVDGESRDARLMFLTGTVVDEPPASEPDDAAKKEEKKRLEELKKKKEPPPPPGYSRRAALVEAALHDQDQAFFDRSIVNQLFHRFFGRGLVMPIDQMHSENPPSHPELLSWLAGDLRSHGYDLTRLIRGIVLSRAYARSSRWDSAAAQPSEHLFSVALIRPLKPWQYAMQLQLAATDSTTFGPEFSMEDLERRCEQMETAARHWAASFELPGQDFQVGVDEALFLSNSDMVAKELLADRPGTLVDRLAKATDYRAASELAIWNTLARPPTEKEVEALVAYLAQRADRPIEAHRQMVWALLTSGECRFNY